jgi:hypothetical protein
MKGDFRTCLVCGVGQLGSRYLQGLAKCRLPLRIEVQDYSRDSLERAQLRWNEVLGPEVIHKVSYHSSIETLPRQIDVAIIATTADSRPHVVGQIAGHAGVSFWVLEKVLAQSESGLDEIVTHVGSGSNAWVNTPRRAMPWHRKIKAQFGLGRQMTLTVKGGAWGLACNAVHFLDLLAWWSGETLQGVTTDGLSRHWFQSKRCGVWEIAGTLEARFSGGSRAYLISDPDNDAVSLEVTDGNRTWNFNEGDGVATRSDGHSISGRLQYQSEMTAPLVESLLEGRGCLLPTLEESVSLHRVFIHSMLEHWRRVADTGATVIPIT